MVSEWAWELESESGSVLESESAWELALGSASEWA
jgi:hypothetical protein